MQVGFSFLAKRIVEGVEGVGRWVGVYNESKAEYCEMRIG